MTDGPEEFPVAPEAGGDKTSPAPAITLEAFVCDFPDCGEEFASRFLLGSHKWNKHGLRGKPPAEGAKSRKKAAGRAKKKRAPSSSSSSSSGESASKRAVLDDVRASLAEAATKGGALVYPALPIPGGYLIATGDEFAGTVTKLAAKNDKLLRWLQGSSEVMDYFALGTWAAGLLVAVGVNFGRIPADGPLAAQWEIDEIARVYLEEQQAKQAATAEEAGSVDGTGAADGSPMGNGDGSAGTVAGSESGAFAPMETG